MRRPRTTYVDDGLPAGSIRWLEAGSVSLYRDASGAVRAVIRGDRSVLRPTLARAFPVTLPGEFIELREEGGRSVGMIRHISELDPSSRKIAEELLQERYMVPVIEEIRSLKMEFGLWFWDVVTDRGERSFAIRSPRDDIRYLPARHGARRVRIADVDGNCYEIENLDALPERSRALYGRMA